jgi:hypothetical protein
MSLWDDDAGYDRTDIKHPDRAGALIDWADDKRKQDRLNGVRNPYVEDWKNEHRRLAAELGRCEYETDSGRCIMSRLHLGGCYVIAGER